MAETDKGNVTVGTFTSEFNLGTGTKTIDAVHVNAHAGKQEESKQKES